MAGQREASVVATCAHAWLVASCVLLLLCSAPLHTLAALSSSAKCSACQALGRELGWAIGKEKPKMNVDLRGRLTPSGKRVGKVIDYNLSELRAYELLEQLCPNMKDYTLVTKDGREQFSKINNVDGPITLSGSISIGGAQDRDAGHQLRVYCDALVEEHEEELIKAVRQAQPGEDNVELGKELCMNTVAVCGEQDLEPSTAELESPKDSTKGKRKKKKKGGKKSKKKKVGESKKKKSKKKSKKSKKKTTTKLKQSVEVHADGAASKTQ